MIRLFKQGSGYSPGRPRACGRRRRWNGSPSRFVETSVSIFVDMFLPSRRHLEDERNRLEWTRDQEGLGDPHRGPIDLDSGSVTIKAPGGQDKTDQDEITKPATP